MQFILKYKAEQQEQQLRLMQSELRNRKLSLKLSLSLAAILLITLVWFMTIHIRSQEKELSVASSIDGRTLVGSVPEALRGFTT
jgi:hypothetical protein